MAEDLVTKALRKIAGKLILALAKELIAQGHKATGSLIESMGSKIVPLASGLELQILMNTYGIFVDSGRRAGGRKVPIDALMKWIRTKGLTSGDKEVRSLAFAIQTSIFKEGVPTNSSRAGGKKTDFIQTALDKVLDDIENILADVFQETVLDSFDVFINETRAV